MSQAIKKFQPPPKSAKNTGAAKQLQKTANSVGLTLKSSSAYKAIAEARMDQVCMQIAQFFLLPSMFDVWKTNDANGTYILEDMPCSWRPGSKQFRRCYVAMSAARGIMLLL